MKLRRSQTVSLHSDVWSVFHFVSFFSCCSRDLFLIAHDNNNAVLLNQATRLTDLYVDLDDSIVITERFVYWRSVGLDQLEWWLFLDLVDSIWMKINKTRCCGGRERMKRVWWIVFSISWSISLRKRRATRVIYTRDRLSSHQRSSVWMIWVRPSTILQSQIAEIIVIRLWWHLSKRTHTQVCWSSKEWESEKVYIAFIDVIWRLERTVKDRRNQPAGSWQQTIEVIIDMRYFVSRSVLSSIFIAIELAVFFSLFLFSNILSFVDTQTASSDNSFCLIIVLSITITPLCRLPRERERGKKYTHTHTHTHLSLSVSFCI